MEGILFLIILIIIIIYAISGILTISYIVKNEDLIPSYWWWIILFTPIIHWFPAYIELQIDKLSFSKLKEIILLIKKDINDKRTY